MILRPLLFPWPPKSCNFYSNSSPSAIIPQTESCFKNLQLYMFVFLWKEKKGIREVHVWIMKKMCFLWPHSRRRNSSQSGREKRCNKSTWKGLFSQPDWLPLGLRGCKDLRAQKKPNVYCNMIREVINPKIYRYFN